MIVLLAAAVSVTAVLVPLVSIGAGNSVSAAVFPVAAVLICVNGMVSPLPSESAPVRGRGEGHRAAVGEDRCGLDAAAQVAAGARHRGVAAKGRQGRREGDEIDGRAVRERAGISRAGADAQYSVRGIVIVKSTCALAVMLPVPVV